MGQIKAAGQPNTCTRVRVSLARFLPSPEGVTGAASFYVAFLVLGLAALALVVPASTSAGEGYL
ncbi:MAG TPA: hypothetical protein VHI52_10475, partial [Verrucomicrobiae bacterium]|nr:hypothetical protein [Verrucomicrobiae bacterium]